MKSTVEHTRQHTRQQLQLNYITLHYATLITLHYTTLDYNYNCKLQLQLQLHYIRLRYANYIALHYATLTTTTATTTTTLLYTTLRQTTLHYTTTTLHCTQPDKLFSCKCQPHGICHQNDNFLIRQKTFSGQVVKIVMEQARMN